MPHHIIHPQRTETRDDRNKTTMRQQQLRHRLWWPLLLLILGWHCNSRNCKVDAAKKCKEDRCLPECVCVLPENEDDAAMCAQMYDKWGWMLPEDSKKDVWKNLDQEYEINYGALKPAGMRGGNRRNGIGRGIGSITDITNTTLTGEVYFEMHPDQLSRNKGWNQESLIVELYGGIKFGLSDCDEGIMLRKQLVKMSGVNDMVDNFEYRVVPFDEYNSAFLRESIECHPRSVNGQMTSVVFTLNDPFYYNEQSASIMNLWYPFRVDDDFGSMEFCVRVEMIDPSYSSEDDDFNDDSFRKRNVTSFIDTKFKVEVSAPSPANKFTRYQEDLSEVKVYSNQAIGPTDDTTTYLPLRYSEENMIRSTTSATATDCWSSSASRESNKLAVGTSFFLSLFLFV